MEDFSQSFLERLDALSRAHSLVASRNWGTTSLKDLVAQILAPHSGASNLISIEGPAVSLLPKTALALSLVLHELVTNAAKYGALSTPNGKLSVLWAYGADRDAKIRLIWVETGMDIKAQPTRSGFGTRLINAVVKTELRGSVSIEYAVDGARYEMELGLSPTPDDRSVGINEPELIS